MPNWTASTEGHERTASIAYAFQLCSIAETSSRDEFWPLFTPLFGKGTNHWDIVSQKMPKVYIVSSLTIGFNEAWANRVYSTEVYPFYS